MEQEDDHSFTLLKSARKGVTKRLKQRLMLTSSSPEPSSCGPSQISQQILPQDNGPSSCKLMADPLYFPVSFTMADADETRTGSNNSILYPFCTRPGLRLPVKQS
jgi:hypothetical protein